MEAQRRWIWRCAVFIAVAAMAAIFVFRANPPRERANIQRENVAYTTGSFVSSPVTVEAGAFLDYKFSLNQRANLVGKFATAGYKSKVDCFVLDENNFESFKSGADFKKILGTGAIPGGKIDRSFKPGTYYLVFDNRSGIEPVDLAVSDFSIE